MPFFGFKKQTLQEFVVFSNVLDVLSWDKHRPDIPSEFKDSWEFEVEDDS